MSFVICKRCKYVEYCTFAPSGTVQECDEFEDMDTAEVFEWNLNDLNKLVAVEKDKRSYDPPDG